jgi:hypothetical protein
MALVEALDSFEHYGSRKRGQRFTVSIPVARKLRDAGLVRVVGEAESRHPKQAAGIPSSASPAARALPQTMSSESESGAKPRRRKKREASS